MSSLIVLCSQSCLDCMWDDSLHMVEYISDADCSLSFPQWFLFYCSFTNILQWRLHYGKMVRILSYSMVVMPLYHSDGLVKSKLVDSLSDQQAIFRVRDKKKKTKHWCQRHRHCILLRPNHSVKIVWGKDVLPASTSSIIDFFFPPAMFSRSLSIRKLFNPV